MTPEAPHVSAVIATRNRAALLPCAVEGALGQQGVDVELVVVDDGSTDDTPALLAERFQGRVRTLRLAGSGAPAARNAGAGVAQGRWLAFLDDDDLWAPTRLATLVAAAEHERAGFAYSPVLMVDEVGGGMWTAVPPSPDEFGRSVLRSNFGGGGCSNIVVRADLFREVGGFDESLHPVEDWDLWIRLSQAARAVTSSEPLLAYREHGSNTPLDARRLVALFAEVERRHRSARARAGVAFDPSGAWRWVAWSALRTGRSRVAAHAFLRAAVARRSPADLARAAGALAGVPAWRRANRRLDRFTRDELPPPAPPWLADAPGWKLPARG